MEAARLQPNDPQAHYALCLYYARTGNTKAATQEFQAVQKLDPKLAHKLSSLMTWGRREKSRLNHDRQT